MKGDWKFAWRSLQRNKRRNTATGLALFAGYFGLILAGGYIFAALDFYRLVSIHVDRLGDVAIFHEGGVDRFLIKPKDYGLSRSEQEAIGTILARDGSVDFTGKYYRAMGLASNGCMTTPFLALGIEPEAERRIRARPEARAIQEMLVLEKGRGFWEDADAGDAILVTPNLAGLLGKTLLKSEVKTTPSNGALDCAAPDIRRQIAADARIQLVANAARGGFSAVDAVIGGRFLTPSAVMEDTGMVAPLSLFSKLFETDLITYLGVFLKSGADRDAFYARISAALRAQGLPASAYLFSDARLNPQYSGTTGFLGVLGAFFATVVLGVVVLSVVNALTLTLGERSREIGTLRAIGFSPLRITGLIVRENLILAAFSLACAALAGFLTVRYVNQLNIRIHLPGAAEDPFFRLAFRPAYVASLGALLLLACWCAAYLSAISRAGRRTVDLLNSEGTGL